MPQTKTEEAAIWIIVNRVRVPRVIGRVATPVSYFELLKTVLVALAISTVVTAILVLIAYGGVLRPDFETPG